MSFFAWMTVACALVGILFFLWKSKDLFFPAVIFNLLWMSVVLLLQWNPMEWFPLAEKVYLILFIGQVSFNVGSLVLLWKQRTPQSELIAQTNASVETPAKNEWTIDYRKACNRLFIIQTYLFITIIPLTLRALAYFKEYGWELMRQVYIFGIHYNYMTSGERLYYIHAIIFPLLMICTYLQIFLWIRGHAPTWHLILPIISLLCEILITAGRFHLLYIMIALVVALWFNRKTNHLEGALKKTVVLRKRIILCSCLVLVAIMAVITVARSYEGGNIFASVGKVVASYFCCGTAIFSSFFQNPWLSGVDHLHWGAIFFNGVLGLLDIAVYLLTFKKVHIPYPDYTTYIEQFFAVGKNQSMNGFTTWYYTFFQDFGWIGVALFPLLLAVLCTWIYKRMRRDPSIANQYFYLLMIFAVIFSSIWWEYQRWDTLFQLAHSFWVLPLCGLTRWPFSKLKMKKHKTE